MRLHKGAKILRHIAECCVTSLLDIVEVLRACAAHKIAQAATHNQIDIEHFSKIFQILAKYFHKAVAVEAAKHKVNLVAFPHLVKIFGAAVEFPILSGDGVRGGNICFIDGLEICGPRRVLNEAVKTELLEE